MTMHLERGLTTLNTKKKKIKRKSDSFYEKGWKEQNKFWKKHKLPTMELSEYIDYVHGKWKPTQQPLKRMDLGNPTTTEPMTRETKLPQPKSQISFNLYVSIISLIFLTNNLLSLV